MESKHKYTADIIFNNKSLESRSSNNLERLTAQVIIYIESIYPNATGLIRDNDSGDVVQTYRKTFVD